MNQNSPDSSDPRAVARKKRQAEALKANMKRRKAAAVEVQEPATDSGEANDLAPL